MSDERIIHSPVSFENGKNADGDSRIINWSRKICSNPESLLIVDPDYEMPVSQDKYDDFVSNDPIRNVVSAASEVSYDPIISCGNDAQEAYSYSLQKGKNKADLEVDLIREKRKEKVILTHGFSDYGYTRGKSFYDGSKMYTIIANGRIEKAQRWIISGKEYAQLWVGDTTPGYMKRAGVWTDVFLVEDLEKDRFVEQLLSRYFKPTDTRAYKPSALKDFRARIYEEIRSAKLENVCETTGWNKSGDKRFFFDGKDFPKKNHLLACLRRGHSTSITDIEEILKTICMELEEMDIGNRISFLVGYGMTTWFSGICSVTWNNSPGVMLLGRASICRKFAELCLKMYGRVTGPDIVSLGETEKRKLMDYIDVLRDDPLVVECDDTSKATLKLAKLIVAGRCVENHGVKVPVVMLQNIPNVGLTYDDYITLDLNGFKVSEAFASNITALKDGLMSVFESQVYLEDAGRRMVSYEEAARLVFFAAKQNLLSAGVAVTVVDNFFAKLERGLLIERYYRGDENATLINMFKQRLEQIIVTKQVCMTGDIESGVFRDPKRSFIVKDNNVYIPSKYMEEVVLGLINISISEFRRVREALIGKELLTTYDICKNYTKRITVSRGERIYAYEFDRELFMF